MSKAVATVAGSDRQPERYELAHGRFVEIASRNTFASEIANRLRDALSAQGLRTNSGRTRMGMLFRIPLAEDENRNREPDLAFDSNAGRKIAASPTVATRSMSFRIWR
jgi:hypothetical protein